MAKSEYKNVRQFIAGILCDEDFAKVDAAMKSENQAAQSGNSGASENNDTTPSSTDDTEGQ